MDRRNTRNILKRKKTDWRTTTTIVFSVMAIWRKLPSTFFFSCPFSKACWEHLGIQWHSSVGFFQKMIQAKQNFSNPFFMEIFFIIAACLHGIFVSKETTSSLIEVAHPLPHGSSMSEKKQDSKLIDCVLQRNPSS